MLLSELNSKTGLDIKVGAVLKKLPTVEKVIGTRMGARGRPVAYLDAKLTPASVFALVSKYLPEDTMVKVFDLWTNNGASAGYDFLLSQTFQKPTRTRRG